LELPSASEKLKGNWQVEYGGGTSTGNAETLSDAAADLWIYLSKNNLLPPS